MAYVEGRTVYDADSHLMELPDWLESYADPDIRARLRPLYLGGAGALADRAVAEAATSPTEPRRPRGTSLQRRVGRGAGPSTLLKGVVPLTSWASGANWSSPPSRRPSSPVTTPRSSRGG